MIEKEANLLNAVVAAEGLVEGGDAPAGHVVGVGAVLEEILEAVQVMPVGFADEHDGEVVGGEAAGLDDGVEGGVVVGLGGVVGDLVVVGVGAACQEKAGTMKVFANVAEVQFYGPAPSPARSRASRISSPPLGTRQVYYS